MEKNKKFKVKKPQRQQLSQVTIVKIMNIGTDIICLLIQSTEKNRTSHLWEVRAKMHNPNLIIRIHQANPDGGAFNKIIGLYSVTVKKDKEKLSNCLRVKYTKEA